VTRPTQPRKLPGPLGTFGPRAKNRGRRWASSGGDGRQLCVAGRVRGARQQGTSSDLWWRRVEGSPGVLPTVEGIGGGGRRSARQSGGRRRGWSGRGGTRWLRDARCWVKGVWEWSEESSAEEVLIVTGDSASASALGGRAQGQSMAWRRAPVHLSGGTGG
jgi:hypothetical protein